MDRPEPRITVQVLGVLNAMLEAPTSDWYGLELARRISLKSGTIYPILARLENAGWVESSWEKIDPVEAGRPRRRLYRLTAIGQRQAQSALVEYRALIGLAADAGARLPSRLRPTGQSV